jgi:predicted Rossmann-fold nucleotide-binding protein
VGIMGAGEPSESNLAHARRLGTLAAQRGWIVLTGGRPAGVMAAACAGAKLVPGSLTLGILPALLARSPRASMWLCSPEWETHAMRSTS